jgi:XRE family transcriptional regulator, fatty acid utilization regulator
MATTGEKIKAAREAKVWGQAELAREVGITPNGLWHIENGKRNPRPSTIRKIAEVLGIDVKELLADEPHP